jgi:hypothetical protein
MNVRITRYKPDSSGSPSSVTVGFTASFSGGKTRYAEATVDIGESEASVISDAWESVRESLNEEAVLLGEESSLLESVWDAAEASMYSEYCPKPASSQQSGQSQQQSENQSAPQHIEVEVAAGNAVQQ